MSAQIHVVKTKRGRAWIRTPEGHSPLFINGRHAGSAKVYWDKMAAWVDLMLTRDYKKSLVEPEWDVFQ